MRLTIPTREVQEGDRLTGVGGAYVTGACPHPSPNRPGRTILYLGNPDPDSVGTGSITLSDDAPIEVDRPDKDAALVERIAQAARAAYYGEGAGGDAVSSWDTMSKATRADWVNAARAALAVATQERGADE